MPEVTKQLSKKRVSKACDCCRKSKTKCDGMRPCKRCLEDGKICTYMNKKKEDKMYPASYVDLLETRVSVLVQALTQLLAKSKEDLDGLNLINFCKDPELLNKEGTFDINKVICNLLSAEKLDNLAESNHNYSIDEITNVTNNSPNDSSINLSKSSPSPPHIHYPLSKSKQNINDHIHKSLPKKSHLHHNNVSSLSSSFQTNFTLGSPTFSSSSNSVLDMRNSSLDITSNNNEFNNSFSYSNIKKEPVELSLESLKNSINNDSTSSSTLSPIENSDSEIFSIETLQSFDNDNWNLNSNNSNPKSADLSNLGFQSINGLNQYQVRENNSINNHFPIKNECQDPVQMADPFSTFNMKFETIFD